jgi:Putative auto-transporter adhesin, head GIN domain
MKTSLPLALAACLVEACSTQTTTGNGQAQTETRTVSAFSKVQNKTSLSVTVTPGPTAVSVTADSNLLPFITTTVNNGELVIDQTQGNLTTHLALSATVTTPALTGLDGQGSGSLSASGFTAETFALDLAGSGAVNFQGSVAALNLTVEGSGATQLSGTSTGLQANLDGSGSVDGTRFPVIGPTQVLVRGSGGANLVLQGDSSLEVDGSGALTVALDGGTTNFTITGSGDILWTGQTTVGQTNVTGSGSVQHR